MNKLFPSISLLLLLLVPSIFLAQPATETTTSLAPGPEDKSLLWKIEGNDLEEDSYLFGTIHLIGADDFFLEDAVKAALNGAEQVTFEINMDDMQDFSKLMPLMFKVMMPGDTTLEDLLPAEDYKIVERHFEAAGMPMFMFKRIKPLFLTAMDPGMIEGNDPMSGGGSKSYEMELAEMARAKEIPMAGLETMEFQMSVFDKIPYKVQAEMLLESVQSERDTTGASQFDEMVRIYKDQDIYSMATMMEGEDMGLGDFEEVLLLERNRNWIPIMGEMMQEGPVFFAVGAGHLGGDEGVIALLRKAGYTLTMVRD